MNVFLRDTEITELEKLIWPESTKNKVHTEGNYNKTHKRTNYGKRNVKRKKMRKI